MSRMKISDNLFLEVAELNRLVKFMTDDGYKRLVKSLITNYGIVSNEDNTYFKPSVDSNSTIKINAGLAYDSNLDAILLKEDTILNISNTGEKRWIILSRATTHYEEGTVMISSDGSLNGFNTKFTEVLRGQPNFPTKIKLESAKNTGEYEVVSVNSDYSAVISGDVTAEVNVRYSVIGTFTPGFQVPDDKKEIYEYDSCSFRIQDSEERPSVSNDEFVIACVYYDNNIIKVLDERIYSMLNKEYGQTLDYSDKSTIVSLLRVSAIGGIDFYNSKVANLELILEHGYTVTAYTLSTTSTTNTFTITSGHCNFWGEGDIPDNVLNGWLIVNRYNMKYSVIDKNVNKTLTISNLNPEMISADETDFIIVPNFSEIEYEVTCKTNNVIEPLSPFYFRNRITNLQTRCNIYSLFPLSEEIDDIAEFKVRYRFIDNSGQNHPFYDISTASFVNVLSETETLANSSFSVDMTKLRPQKEGRNYS